MRYKYRGTEGCLPCSANSVSKSESSSFEGGETAWKAGTLPTELLPLCVKQFPVSMVGVRGLEPPTSASQTLRANHLRYTP